MSGLGFPPLFSLMFLKKLLLLLYFMFVPSIFNGFVFIWAFFLTWASNFVIPPYSIFLFSAFLACYFFLCLAIRLFFSLLACLSTYFSDSKISFPSLFTYLWPFHNVKGTFSSTTIAYVCPFLPLLLVGWGTKLKLDKESKK